MAVPKKRTSKSRQRMRHSHSALKPVGLTRDSEGNLSLSHRASLAGIYKTMQVVPKKEDTATKKA